LALIFDSAYKICEPHRVSFDTGSFQTGTVERNH